MIPLAIFPNGDGMLDDVGTTRIHEADDLRMGVLKRGTTSGAPSVGIACRLPNGEYVLVQTTLKLLLTAADAFKAVHGDPRT